MELVMFGLILTFLIIINTPIAFAIAIGSLFYLIVEQQPHLIIAQRMFSGADSFALLALPLFMLTGYIMNYAGISQSLIRFATAIVGHISGGLAVVNVVVSMFFAGISGTSTADTAATGSVLIPGMVKKGYPADHAAAVTAASSTIGIIIPPSIPMVIHGVAAGVSIGTLFIAGIIPGILVGLGQMVVAYLIAKKNNYPVEQQFSGKELFDSFKAALPGLTLPVIIIGGITFGIYTPTEAGAISSIYALLLGFINNRKELISNLHKIFTDSIIMSAMVMIIIATSGLMGWVLTYQQIPQALTGWLLGLTANPLLMLFLLVFLLIVLGTIFHGAPIQLIVVPMLLPIVASLDINPIQFGMIVILAVGISQLTPPVGSALFVASAIAKEDIFKVSMANIPFLVVNLAVLVLIILFPKISLVLVDLFR